MIDLTRLSQVDQAQVLPDLHKVVAILFYGRSGSMFLGSLLDGHPQLVATPGTILMDFYNRFWPQHGSLPLETLLREFTDYYVPMFDARQPGRGEARPNVGKVTGLTKMGSTRSDYLVVDREAFVIRMRRLLSGEAITRKRFFQATHVAYCHSSGHQSINTNTTIVFPMHIPDADRSVPLLEDFPSARFLHVVREPAQALASHFRHHFTEDRPVFTSGFFNILMRGVLLGGHALVDGDSRRSIAVRLEDLHSRPRQTLRALAGWLGIEWNDCLLSSTFNGVQWWNVDKSPEISGFSDRIIARPQSDLLSRLDRNRLQVLTAPQSRAWGYSVRPWLQSRLTRFAVVPLLAVPFRMEWMTWNLQVRRRNPPLQVGRLLWHYARMRGTLLKALLDARRPILAKLNPLD